MNHGQNDQRRKFLMLAAATMTLVPLASCAELQPGAPDPVRSEVERLVAGLERALRMGGWSAAERYFSRDFRGNISDLQDRMDLRRRTERNADWRLTIGRVLTQEKWVSVGIRWSRRWTDLQGKPQVADGNGELILQRESGELRIVQMNGLP